MLEVVGDIWEHSGEGIVVITTSGSLNHSGRALFGRGVARQALQRFPGLDKTAGELIGKGGNHVYDLSCGIVTFPVEETAWSQPDLRLISRSARELRQLADRMGWQNVFVPRPGCGGGGLLWRDVRPLLEPFFDARFLILSWPDENGIRMI